MACPRIAPYASVLPLQVRKNKLVELDLSGSTGFDDNAIKGLAVHCPSLATLKLVRRCAAHREAPAASTRPVTPCWASLCAQDSCPIGDEGMGPIAKFCPLLRVVSVEGCNPGCSRSSLGLLHSDCVVTGGMQIYATNTSRPGACGGAATDAPSVAAEKARATPATAAAPPLSPAKQKQSSSRACALQ